MSRFIIRRMSQSKAETSPADTIAESATKRFAVERKADAVVAEAQKKSSTFVSGSPHMSLIQNSLHQMRTEISQTNVIVVEQIENHIGRLEEKLDHVSNVLAQLVDLLKYSQAIEPLNPKEDEEVKVAEPVMEIASVPVKRVNKPKRQAVL